MADEVFLKLEGIKKSFGGVHALKGVDLEIRKGEIHCLAGENGCGKSTLIKAISGVHNADEGSIWIDGEKVEKMKPMDAINRGIQVIYQDFAVFPNLTVAENIALNGELKNKIKFVNWKQIHETARLAMEQVGAHIDPDVKLERLSVANKQMVAICRAIINDAKLLILDEPTTALTAREVDKLWDIVRKLKEKGIAVMIVNHKLDEIYRIADRLTILRNGAYVSSGPISEYDQARFTRDMTGHDVSDEKYHPAENAEEILRVEHLTRKGAFEDVSFTLNRVYTEWYRNQGYDFTITSSTAFDHKWIYGRNIFESISLIVDEIFDNYLSRPGVRQPILTQYCDGRQVQCPNWMTQWGSCSLGEQGYSPIEILRHFYGDSIYVNTAEQISGIPASWPGSDLTIGSTGDKVRQMQEQLDEIATVYSAIPRVTPDGIYGSGTANAVREFQSIFGLPQTGVVDFATWYKISHIYVGITRIAELV